MIINLKMAVIVPQRATKGLINTIYLSFHALLTFCRAAILDLVGWWSVRKCVSFLTFCQLVTVTEVSKLFPHYNHRTYNKW